ncbi:MAG: hypothetical protein ACQESR_19460 [Planctomycetota bacterium]
MAPRMADRFAAAAMLAGHPNDASPLGLRNPPFTIHAGDQDSAYNRNNIARQWGEKLDELKQEDSAGYVHWTKIYNGKGHWLDGEDQAALPWMGKHTRNPLPDRIVWRQDDVTHWQFYWLAVKPEEQCAGTELPARRRGQEFQVQAEGLDELIIHVNDSMLDSDEQVMITSKGEELYRGHIRRSIGTLARTLAERGDPTSIFSGEVAVKLDQ